VWQAYWNTASTSPIDWGIWAVGGLLILAQLFALVSRVGWLGRFLATRVWFVQDLDRYRTVCLLITELLPVLGLLGTVWSLMFTFHAFQEADTPNLSQMVRAFAPAMSTTISGLGMIIPNLLLNAILWLACSTTEKGDGRP
jgi:hypothetical protein